MNIYLFQAFSAFLCVLCVSALKAIDSPHSTLLQTEGGSLTPLLEAQEEPLLILNMANEEILPRKFRTSRSSFRFLRLSTPSREGLDDLHISGSGQFSQLSWKAIVKAINYDGPIYDIDLRQETHGFLNGAAISLYAKHDWGNRGKSGASIRKEEDAWLDKLKQQKEVTVGLVEEKDEGVITKTKPMLFKVLSVLSEQQVIEEAKAGYFRLYVLDHTPPFPEQVDAFMQFVAKLPKNAWIHFHCAAGSGRTTTFMTMYDIMRNAKKVSFDDIVARQYYIGGADLSKPVDPNEWKSSYAYERQVFLKRFYEYAKSNADGFKTPWRAFFNQPSKQL